MNAQGCKSEKPEKVQVRTYLEAHASLELGMLLSQSVTQSQMLDKLLVKETQLGSKLVLPDPDQFLTVPI